MNELFKRIIVKALIIRKQAGEDIDAVIATYTNLTEAEKADIMKDVNAQ